MCLTLLFSPAHYSHQTLCSGTGPLEAGWSKNNQHCPQHTLAVQTGERGSEGGSEGGRKRGREEERETRKAEGKRGSWRAEVGSEDEGGKSGDG